MRVSTRQPSAKLTLLSRLSPTSWAANRQHLFLTYFHNDILRRTLRRNCSILNRPRRSAGVCPFTENDVAPSRDAGAVTVVHFSSTIIEHPAEFLQPRS